MLIIRSVSSFAFLIAYRVLLCVIEPIVTHCVSGIIKTWFAFHERAKANTDSCIDC
jgi:hypothetical protein